MLKRILLCALAWTPTLEVAAAEAAGAEAAGADTRAASRAGQEDFRGFMAGWDEGLSCKWRIAGRNWLGFNAMFNASREEASFHLADPGTLAGASPRVLQGTTRGRQWMGSVTVVFEAERQVYRMVYLNPYLSAGFGRDGYDSDRSENPEYNPVDNRESNSLNLIVGIAPTVRFGRAIFSIKYGVRATKTWGEDHSEYSYPGDLSVHSRDTYPENMTLSLFGNSNPHFTNISVHWLF